MKTKTVCNKKITIIIFFMLMITPFIIQAQDTIYVDIDATGNDDGTSWVDAYKYLQDALLHNSVLTNGDEIWVAEGTYYPDEGDTLADNNRFATFQLNLTPNISLYGGFNGTETSLDQRNIAVNETILSGDLNKDDPANLIDNTWHVVTCDYATQGTTIDGFTITAGNASGSDPYNKGAGIYSLNAQTNIRNCIIKNNSATDGGGIYNDGASLTIINCIFLNNSASQNGGGMYNETGSNPSLYNCTFSNNTAGTNGNGIYNISPPNLINCIVWGTSTDQVYNSGTCNPSVIYSNIKVATGDTYNDGYTENDSLNINSDPLFRNANSNLLLNSGSPCFGTGTAVDNTDTHIPDTDKDSRPRPLPESATNIDMGAYEQFDSDGSLPVQLFLFSASCENVSVVLSWRTESEVDHQGFILERKEKNRAYQIIASYEIHEALRAQDNTSSSTDYEFNDEHVIPGTTYYYRLSDVSTQGHITAYPPVSITVDKPPLEIKLDNAYPNPFNPQTYIGYHLPGKTRVRLTVVDMLGRKVKNLYNDMQNAGNYHVYWNGNDDTGNQCPSGVYIIQLQTVNITKTRKVMLLK